MTEFEYVGRELQLFSRASHWKAYIGSVIVPHLKGDVLEVGAGIGANTENLLPLAEARWTCVEPDGRQADRIRSRLDEKRLRASVVQGTLADIPAQDRFDAILYLDVLEHIEDDRSEVARAIVHLKAGGKLIVLAPARQELFSEFDSAIGHFRRYNRDTLTDLIPGELRQVDLRYLDSAGYFASLANRFLLKQGNPTASKITFWDRFLVPASRVSDRLLGYRFGRSLLGIWKLPA